MKDTLRKYAEQNKDGDEWPAWYFHHDAERADSNFKYPDEQPHPSTKDHSPNWDRSIKPAGPIGLLCSRLVSGFMATPVLSLIDRHVDSGHVSSAMASDGAKTAPT